MFQNVRRLHIIEREMRLLMKRSLPVLNLQYASYIYIKLHNFTIHKLQETEVIYYLERIAQYSSYCWSD